MNMRFVVAWLGCAATAFPLGYRWLVDLQPALPIVPLACFAVAFGCVFAAGQRFAEHKAEQASPRIYRVTRRAR
ncbi:MAG: hypothetical protein EHM18_12045 [Acidobacteria bacterium]|nr:MAG: hypothetical protein EHM18_12045 [Acidobacteriota bacterium]